MNFPEPSGSSPPENPPGMNKICDSRKRFAKASVDSLIASGVWLRMTKTSGSAPTAANGFAVSYSQFVPGNTGISTRGLGVETSGLGQRFVCHCGVGTIPSCLTFVGYTGSSLSSQSPAEQTATFHLCHNRA